MANESYSRFDDCDNKMKLNKTLNHIATQMSNNMPQNNVCYINFLK